MIVKSLTTGITLVTALSLTHIPHQPVCYKEYHEVKGWHNASKACPPTPAKTWQEYYSGGHTRPEL